MDMNLSKLQEVLMDREAWHAALPRVTKSQTWLSDWTELSSNLNILCHYLSLGLEWKLTFSSPVATAKFSKFADMLSAAFFSIIFQDLK